MRLPFLALAVLATLSAVPARAAEAPAAPPPAPVTVPATTTASADDRPATQAELKALTEEVRRLKLEMSVPDVIQFGSYSGAGVGASKVHYQPKGLSIGGYGELVYSNLNDGRGAYAEVLRLVLYVGYRFNDWIVFNSEVEFEHGAREIGIEMAYFDFLFADALKLRVGNVLVPVGFLNENHEPIFFYGVYRPLVDRYIIPTTWNQLGGGIYGEVGPLRYKAYAIAGLDAFGAEPLEAGSWIRNARQGEFGAARTWAGVVNANVLVPVGFLNENHEPIFFYGVYRPLVDRYIIPTTWNQLGGGIYGEVGPLRYKAYAIAGLDAFGAEPLEAGSWIRNARQGEFGAARTWAGVVNANVDVGPATFGGSIYFGNAGQGYVDATGQRLSPWVTLGEIHALVAWRGLTARGILALGSLSQSGEISRVQNLAPEQYIGSRAWGGYLEVGYDVLTLVGSSLSLSPFFRFEALNPQAAVASGGVLDPALDQRVYTVGVDFKPIPQVVVKADWQGITSKVPGLLYQWDLGVGFVY